MKQYLLKPLWWEQGGTPAEACTIYPELFSDCFLTELSVCKRQRVGETACVYVCEAEGGDTTPPPVDWASLTGWRGRWGHRNKANTHTHFFSYGCYVLVSLSRLRAAILPQLAQKTSVPHRLAPSPAPECPSTFHLPPLPARAPIPSSLTVR